MTVCFFIIQLACFCGYSTGLLRHLKSERSVQVCAVWHLFGPTAATKLADYKRERRLHYLHQNDLYRFVNQTGCRVIVLEQKPGDLVIVPPAWAHQVLSIRPCLKLAWDRLTAPQELPASSAVHAHLKAWRDRDPQLAVKPASDYFGALRRCWSVVADHP